MYGIEDVCFATPVFAEETNGILVETELRFTVVTKILEAEAAKEHKVKVIGDSYFQQGLKV